MKKRETIIIIVTQKTFYLKNLMPILS